MRFERMAGSVATFGISCRLLLRTRVSCMNFGRRRMGKPVTMIREEEVDAALEAAADARKEPLIESAAYFPEPGMEFLMLRLDDGRRLLVPREELSELKNATAEQAADVIVVPSGTGVWWPKLDDGLYLPDFLEYRWGKRQGGVAA
jgi:hypothetical protein